MRAAEARQAKIALEHARAPEAEAKLAADRESIEAAIKLAAPPASKPKRSEDEFAARRAARAERQAAERRKTCEYQLAGVRQCTRDLAEHLRMTCSISDDATLTELVTLAAFIKHYLAQSTKEDDEIPPPPRPFVMKYAPDLVPDFEAAFIETMREKRTILEAALAEIESRIAKFSPVLIEAAIKAKSCLF
jgi:hypothetical protein